MNLPPEFEKAYPEIHQYVRDLEADNQALREEVALLKKEHESDQRRIRILEKQRPPNADFPAQFHNASPRPIQERKNSF